jgi:hypothetical protein
VFCYGLRFGAITVGGILAIFAIVSTVSMASASDPNFSTGAELYRCGRHKDAIPYLEKVCRREPGNFTARYYLANCFAKSMDGYRAQREYRECLKTGPDSLVATYCRSALAAYSRDASSFHAGLPRAPSDVNLPPTADVTFWNPGSSSVSFKSQVPNASKSGRDKNVPADLTPLPLPSTFDTAIREKTLNRIATQASDYAKRLGDVQEDRKASLQRAYLSAAERKRAQGKSIVESMKTEKIRIGQKLRPKYVQEDYHSVLAHHEKEAQDIEMSARKAVEMHTALLSRRQAAIAESAASLTSQLTRTPTIADSTAIEPLNTGLYVRNYQPISRLLDKLPPVTPQIAKADTMNFLRPLSAHPRSRIFHNRKDLSTPCTTGSEQEKIQSSGGRKIKTEVRGELLR